MEKQRAEEANKKSRRVEEWYRLQEPGFKSSFLSGIKIYFFKIIIFSFPI